MLNSSQLHAVVQRVHAFPEFRGCAVGYYSGYSSHVVFAPRASEGPNVDKAVIVVEELPADKADMSDLQPYALRPTSSPEGQPPPKLLNKSRLVSELVGVGWNCGVTAVSLAGVGVGVAGELPTAGASTALVMAGLWGFRASAAQCLNSLFRVGMIMGDPGGNSLQILDENTYYKYTMLFIDAVGVGAGVVNLPAAWKQVMAVRNVQRAFSARGLSLDRLARMNRTERSKWARFLLDEAAKTPEGLKAVKDGLTQAEITFRHAGLSVKSTQKVVHLLNAERAKRLLNSLREVVLNGVGIGMSATPDRWTGGASGVVNALGTAIVVHLLETTDR